MILAILAFSAAAMAFANASSTIVNPYVTGGGLVSSTTLSIAGSSTVYPIAVEEAGQFPTYWNNLLSANSGFGGADQCTVAITPSGQGSGFAVGALTGGTADIGEMSRPPSSATTGTLEWHADNNLQIWAVGIDSVAIVISGPNMASWFPQNLNTLQVAQLFMTTPPTTSAPAAGPGNYNGLKNTSPYCDFTNSSSYYNWTPNTPYFTTWGSFLDYYYNGSANLPTGIPSSFLSETIQRAVRDPTSGTFDCFDNYFIKPNGFEAEYKNSAGAIVTDTNTGLTSQDMAPYSFCETNQIVVTTMQSGGDWIGFVSLGVLTSSGSSIIPLNIAFTTSSQPTVFAANPTFGGYVTPTIPNVKYAVSQGAVKGASATGEYLAWRWLWEVTPEQIPSTGPLLETGVWIAYMRAYNTTNTGASDFVNDNGYIELCLADIAGGQVLDSNLAAYTPTAGQTQSIPQGKVNFHDVTYFVAAYLAYANQGIYNPYADPTAQGKINFNSVKAFVTAYLGYYANYNP
jgi:ABC-type phosphate transport system substrate-binding protein